APALSQTAVGEAGDLGPDGVAAPLEVVADDSQGGNRGHRDDRIRAAAVPSPHDRLGDRAVARGRQSSAFSGASGSPAPATTRMVPFRRGSNSRLVLAPAFSRSGALGLEALITVEGPHVTKTGAGPDSARWCSSGSGRVRWL